MKRLWVTGYRAYELSVFQDDDPKVKVVKSVLKSSFEALLNMSDEEFWLISGPQMGIERWAIEVATELKTTYPQLKTSIIEPYQAVSQRWNEQNQAKLLETLAKVDFHAAVSNQPYQSPQQLRDYQRFMLEHSDQLLMVFDVDRESDSEQPSKPSWDYRAAQQYQAQHDYPIQLINFDDLQEAATEIAEQEAPDY